MTIWVNDSTQQRFVDTLCEYVARKATAEDLRHACRGLHGSHDAVPARVLKDVEAVLGRKLPAGNDGSFGSVIRQITKALKNRQPPRLNIGQELRGIRVALERIADALEAQKRGQP